MSVKQLNLYNDKILSALEQVIEVNKESKNFSVRFLQRKRRCWIGCPRTPRFLRLGDHVSLPVENGPQGALQFFIIKCKFSKRVFFDCCFSTLVILCT